jgi:hypothetical protein
MEKLTSGPGKEEVVREFAPLGKYRVRLLRNPKHPQTEPSLDIREFVNNDRFEGFTRRGIRLSDRAQMDLLRDILKEALERDGFQKPAPGMLPLG